MKLAEAAIGRLRVAARLLQRDGAEKNGHEPDVDRVGRIQDVLLEGGESLELAGLHVDVVAVPGHSPGHLAYAVDGVLLSGDVLFAGSVGRTDLPGGDWPTLLASISTLAERFPPGTAVHPGHGPSTTLAAELAHNPFLAELRGLANPGGRLLLSIPNLANASVVRDLLLGRFDYAYMGLTCVGHLRFFTRGSLAGLLRATGFEPASIEPAGGLPLLRESLVARARRR